MSCGHRYTCMYISDSFVIRLSDQRSRHCFTLKCVYMHSCGARKAIYLNSFLNVMLLILRYLATSRSKNLVSRYFVSFCNLDCAANQIILGYRFSKIVLTLFESAHQKLNMNNIGLYFCTIIFIVAFMTVHLHISVHFAYLEAIQ